MEHQNTTESAHGNAASYIIKLDDRIIWRGKNLKSQIKRVKKKNPNNKISIIWKSDQEFLIG
jgi:hypothetical protein